MFPPDPLVLMLPNIALPVTDNSPPVDKLPPDILPEAVKLDNVPTDVILGCALVVNVPVNKLAPIVPLLAYTLPLITLPLTDRLDSVPKLVKLAEVIPEARVEPVKFAALAVIATLAAAVNCP